LAAFAACAATLNGCTVVSGSSPRTLVRLINATYNAPAVDAYMASTAIAYNIGSPSVTSYAYLAPGAATASVDLTGTQTAIAQAQATFLAGQMHSIYFTGASSSYQATILMDQNTPAPSGQISVRFLQQAVSAGAVDIYFVPGGSTLADSNPVLANAQAGLSTSYFNIPAGTYTVVILPAGTVVPTVVDNTFTTSYTGTPTTFNAGAVRTFLVVDNPLSRNSGVNIVTADDLD
jgi:hypothetical protein